MGIHIGISHSQIHHGHPVFFMENAHQTDWLFHIRLCAIAFPDPKTIRVGITVIYTDSGCHQKTAVLMGFCRSDPVSQKARAVLKTPSVKPRPLIGREQLRQQIAVTRFHIHRIKSCLLRQKGSFPKLLLQSL